MSETKFGAGSKANAFALRAMASVYVKQKRNDLAKFTLDDARKIIQSHQEDDPVEMIRFLLDYAEWQGSSGDRTGGVETSRDALTRARKLAEGVKTPHMDGLLCRVLKRLIDQLAASPSPAPAELSALRGELRKLLEGLRDHSALDAEETRWLQELGAATAKSPDSAAGSP